MCVCEREREFVLCESAFHPLVSQVGMYHEQHPEDAGSSKENRMIYSDSMPRRVGSFYRGERTPTGLLSGIVFLDVSYEQFY